MRRTSNEAHMRAGRSEQACGPRFVLSLPPRANLGVRAAVLDAASPADRPEAHQSRAAVPGLPDLQKPRVSAENPGACGTVQERGESKTAATLPRPLLDLEIGDERALGNSVPCLALSALRTLTERFAFPRPCRDPRALPLSPLTCRWHALVSGCVYPPLRSPSLSLSAAAATRHSGEGLGKNWRS